jgi:hypothetical protein
MSDIPSPFKGLAAYKEGEILYERDADVELVKSRLWSGRYTVLFAGSGVGKTSFLRAKLVGALKDSLGVGSVTMLSDWTEKDPVQEIVNFRNSTLAENSTSLTRVLILDQFEELFQSFPNLTLLNRLGNQLATFSQTDSALDVRVLIATREEFLADLSTFEDFMPGLFTNYYRLERPIVSQAKSIILQTSKSVNVAVDSKIDDLLDDLKLIKREDTMPDTLYQVLRARMSRMFSSKNVDAKDVSQRSNSLTVDNQNRRLVNVIDPPYLQIVCKRIWDRENPDISRPFLSTYSKGEAIIELEAYTNEKLAYLPARQRALISQAVGHLTGPHESKRYMPLNEIAQAIRTRDVDSLRMGLTTLCSDEAKILKGAKGIYGLYHDMYAPMLWTWREKEFRKRQFRKTAWTLGIAVAVAFFLIYPLLKWWSVKEALNAPAYGNRHDYSTVLSMRNALSNTVVWRWFGDCLWRSYNERLSTAAALRMDTDGAILYRLAALSTTSDPTSAEVSHIVRPIEHLLTTFDVKAPDVFADVALHNSPSYLVEGTAAGSFARIALDGDTSTHNFIVEAKIPKPDDPNVPLPQIKFLGFSPSGDAAIMAWVFQTPAGENQSTTATDVYMGAYNTRDGHMVTGPTKLPSLSDQKQDLHRPLGVSQTSGPASGSIGIPQPILTAMQEMRATFSEDGRELALVVPGGVFIFDFDPAESKLGTLRSQLSVRHVTTVGFSQDHNVIGIAHLPPPSDRAFPGLGDQVEFFSLATKKKYPQASAILPPSSKFVFRRDGAVLLNVNSRWEWIVPTSSMNSHRHEILVPENLNQSTPQCFDDQSGSLLVEDHLGRLTIISTFDSDEKPTALPSTEPRRGFLSPEPRTFSTASLHDFSQGKRFLSIDHNGNLARLWEVPNLSSRTTQVTLRSLPTPRGVFGDGACTTEGQRKSCKYRTLDGQWLADIKIGPSGGDLSVTGESGTWGAKGLPHTPPQTVQLSKTGTRALLSYKDEIVYVQKGLMSNLCYEGKKSFIKSALGPGKDQVTFLTATNVEVYQPSKTWQACDAASVKEPPTEWDEETNGALTNLAQAHSGAEAVIVYSSRWAHFLASPHEDWPSITTVFLDSPGAPEDPGQFVDDIVVQSSGNPVSISDTATDLSLNTTTTVFRSLFASPWELKLCEDREGAGDALTLERSESKVPSQAAHWRSVMCQVEYRTHRHTGTSATQ